MLPYICVVPASCVTACSRDGTPWEQGADSLTCRCLRPTRASNLVVTWGGEGGGGVGVSMIMGGGLLRLLGAVEAVARGKLLCAG